MSERPWFDILEVVGAGTYGAVCLARPLPANGRGEIILKVLRSEHVHDERVLQRTRDEARILRALRHPNMVHVHALIEVANTPIVVMEYIPGISLYELQKAHPRAVPTPIAIEVVRRAAVGLDAAYNKPTGPALRPLRIVHRDIKPSNILLSIHGEVKLVDFGIAKAFFIGRESETFSVVLGTRGFMAPERIDGGPDSPAGDIYALGLVLLELLSGEPTELSIHPETHRRQLADRIRSLPLRDVGHRVRELLAEVVEGMCAYDLGERLRPGEAALALGQLLNMTGLHPDLPAYARRVVLPLHDGRPRITPEEHPVWREVSFLAPEPHVRRQLSSSDDLLRAFLDRDGWELRTGELVQLLSTLPDWSDAPFLELLDEVHQRRSWWRRPPDGPQLQAILRVLRHRRSTEVQQRVRKLLRHPDPRVVSAARHYLLA